MLIVQGKEGNRAMTQSRRAHQVQPEQLHRERGEWRLKVWGVTILIVILGLLSGVSWLAIIIELSLFAGLLWFISWLGKEEPDFIEDVRYWLVQELGRIKLPWAQ